MNSASGELTSVEERIGYAFRDRAHLATALTHSSASSETRQSYQRFEFLGDRVLGLVIAGMLLEAYPKAPEGELSRRLAELVRKETCADVAAELSLGSALRSAGGKAQRNAILTLNVLGDLCEAVIGAIYLDGGLDPAASFIARNWRERMLAAPGPHRNPKVTLQEWAQSKGYDVPSYTITNKIGPDHEPKFEVEVVVAALAPARGEGRTRRDAEQAAAATLLRREGVWKDER